MSHDGLPEPPTSGDEAVLAVVACITGAVGAIIGDVWFGFAGGVAGFVALGAAGYFTAMLLNSGSNYIARHEREVVQGVTVCIVTILVLETIVHYVRNGW